MSKERLSAFTDAILAIIMTILVLELKKPEAADWASLWALRSDFFSYAVSFFWLGAMWVNIHNQWSRIEKIDNKVICVSLSNMALGRAVAGANGQTSTLDYSSRRIVAADLIIKAVGIILAIFIYPPITMFAVILAGCVVTFLPHFVSRRNIRPGGDTL